MARICQKAAISPAILKVHLHENFLFERIWPKEPKETVSQKIK
jgi:hypothetical protein